MSRLKKNMRIACLLISCGITTAYGEEFAPSHKQEIRDLVREALAGKVDANGAAPSGEMLPKPVMDALLQSLRNKVSAEDLLRQYVPLAQKQELRDEVKVRAAFLTLASAKGNCGAELSSYGSPSVFAMAAARPSLDLELKEKLKTRFDLERLSAVQKNPSVEVVCPNPGSNPIYPSPIKIPSTYNPNIYKTNNAKYEYSNFDDVVTLTLDGAFFCSGTLVDSKWIITAAHCVTEVSGGSYKAFDPGRLKFYKYGERGTDSFKSLLSDGKTVAIIKGRKLRPISTVFVHPDYLATSSNYTPSPAIDQALLEVTYDGPPPKHHVVIANSQDIYTGNVSVVGYGFSNTSYDVRGDKPHVAWNSLDHSTVHPEGVGWLYLEPDGTGTICYGDSGGAIFAGHLTGELTEKHQLVAIVGRVVGKQSFGGVSPQGDAASCAGAASIDSPIKAINGYRFLCEKSGNKIPGCLG